MVAPGNPKLDSPKGLDRRPVEQGADNVTSTPPVHEKLGEAPRLRWPYRRKHWVIASIAVLALAAASTAMLLVLPTPGSLLTEYNATVCLPGNTGGTIQMAASTLDNSDSSTPVTVTSVTLPEAENMELASAWLLSMADWVSVRTGDGFNSSAPEFGAALPVDSDGLAVVPAGQTRGLLLELRVPDAGGQASQLRVAYKSNFAKYASKSDFDVQIADVTKGCF